MIFSPASRAASLSPRIRPLASVQYYRFMSISATQMQQKRIGVIGAGTAGIGAMIGLLDVPKEARKEWTIEVLEQRKDVGGLWFKDDSPPDPPRIPESPAYPLLHTNTPAPTMTFPQLNYPINTPLFPSYPYVQKYHRLAVEKFGIEPHIQYESEVISATYSQERKWSVHVHQKGKEVEKEYDTLVVANGHLRFPTRTTWEGEEEWLAKGDGNREITHALWYREPERYKGRTVVVIGFGASGWDMSGQTVYHADKVYHSFEEKPTASIKYPVIPGTEHKVKISHFTPDSIVFRDGSTLSLSPDSKISILVGTGYDLLVPFLPQLKIGELSSDLSSSSTPHTLTSNRRYLRPLHEDTFALDPQFPTTALAFAGLHSFISNAQESYVQGLYIGHALADEGVLKERETMVKELGEWEESMRKRGTEPLSVGHKFPHAGGAEDYQDHLIDLLRTRSSLALPSHISATSPFVPSWRRRFALRATAFYLRKGWKRAVELGVEKQFVEGVETEEEWVKAMERLEEWEKGMDKEQERSITWQPLVKPKNWP